MSASIDDDPRRAPTASAGAGSLRLTLAGSAASLQHGQAPALPLARLDAALLAVLALDGVTSRQRLLALLWPDQEPEAARNALRQRLFRLRRAAGADVVTGSEQLRLADGVSHDLHPGAEADAIEPAGATELLAGFDWSDQPEFDDWLAAQREALRERRRAHIDARIAACERDARYAEGASLAARRAAADPLDEAALRQAMRLHYLAGQRAAALALHDAFAAALQRELRGVQPAAETQQLAATIRNAAVPPSLPASRRDIPASVLRPPRLIGRDAELRALGAAWSDAKVFWLLGEAGLGKSRLIQEFAQLARSVHAADVRAGPAEVLVVAARPGDAGVPYASLGRALRALAQRRPLSVERADTGLRHELARVLPELASAAMPQPRAVATTAQLGLRSAIGAMLADAQRDGIAALVFDDLHFADAASVEMLQSLVGDETLATLRWGFAQRPAEGVAALDALRSTLEEAQRVDPVALAPLAVAQMAELIDSLQLSQLDAAALAPSLTRHTGGNPLYALETIKHLIVSDGPLPTALPRPASIGQLIERRLKQLSPPALGLARVAAIAGVDFGIELAQAVLDTRALALADAWRELESAQVLRGNAFAHDLVYEATLASVPAPIAAHTHGEVAAFLEAHGGEPARVAAHWLAACQPPRALGALHAAADAAKRAMRRREEAAFLDRAARIESEASDHTAAFASLSAMIEALFLADFPALDAPLFDRLDAAATSDAQRARALANRANWQLERGELDPALALARRAVEMAEAAGDGAVAADARQRLGQILDWRGDYPAAAAVYQQALPWTVEHAGEMERAMFYSRLAITLDNSDRGREARGYHQRTIEMLRDMKEWALLVVVLENLATSWAMAGYVRRAIDTLREALRLAAAHDEAQVAGASLPASMFRRLRDLGCYDEALRWLEPALGTDATMFSALSRCHVACGWIYLGQHARAQHELDLALKAEPPDWVRAKALQMCARLKLALGQRAGPLLDEALRIVQPQAGRRYLSASIMLDHALTRRPDDALAAARQVVADGERLDLPGTAFAGHVRAARFAVEARRPDDAAAHAVAALAIGDEVMPNDLYPAERWLNAWRAFQLAGRKDEADEQLARGAAWVRATLQAHVPEPFRDSFVRANSVNQQLLRAAAAVGL